MTQYDNEFFRGPPEGSQTLATDQRPTGAEVFQSKPEKSTASVDIPVTQEELPKDPPKKEGKGKRITKAIKLLASCMAAVVITEAAVDMAATIEVPTDIPVGQYYAGQWPGVSATHSGVYVMERDADLGYSIQMPLEGEVWRLTADTDWRMCWYEGTNSGVDMAYFSLKNQVNGVSLMADLTAEPLYTEYEEDCYTTMTTSTGETLYIRAYFLSLGKYEEEYGLEDYGQSEEMLAASAELRQALVEEIFAGIQVTPGTEDGWQGFQIGDYLYSQQSETWYGLGGFGDLEIHIPWVHYADDHNLHNMTPYSRVTVNGITWSIYFTDNDEYLWAVPNIDPSICLGGLTARFMCADAVRHGEYINDEEWTGFTSLSQRQTAVDIMVECLQHHYALAADNRYATLTEWPQLLPVTEEQVSYAVSWQSRNGQSVQFALNGSVYRVSASEPGVMLHWHMTNGDMPDQEARLHVGEWNKTSDWSAVIEVRETPFPENWKYEDAYYTQVQADNGEILYVSVNDMHSDEIAEGDIAALARFAEELLPKLRFRAYPDGEGWHNILLCDTMYTVQSEAWDGVGSLHKNYGFGKIREITNERWATEDPCAVRTINGITWSFYYDEQDEMIWARPAQEPGIALGADSGWMQSAYRSNNVREDGAYEEDEISQAVGGLSLSLKHIYRLGEEAWYIPDWPTIHQITTDHSLGLMNYSSKATFAQFSMGNESYRLDSRDSNLRFYWDGTGEVDGAMEAELHVSYMNNLNRDWWVKIFVRETPFTEPRDEDWEIDATLSVSGGSTLYLRFRCMSDAAYTTFTGWATQIMDAISASPADPNGWGQVWICDLMTSPVSANWDGNAMVTDNYEIPYFNRAEEQGLWELEPYAYQEINGIFWTFIYEEADDIIWALPDFDLRPDVQWCIGAPARGMAEWFVDKPLEEDYLDAAVEGLMYGLGNYYPRDGIVPPQGEVPAVNDWPSILATDNSADVTYSIDSRKNTDGLFSLNGSVFEIESYQEDLRFLWTGGDAYTAYIDAYSMEDGYVRWAVTMSIQTFPFEIGGNETDIRSVRLPGGDTLYIYFESWHWDGTPLEVLIDEIMANTAFDYCGKEENWHTIYIGNTLQTQQHYNWNGLGMVYDYYTFWYVHDADAYDVHQQDYEGQRTINGILWTFRFHKDNDILYAYPESEPELCIGTDPSMLYNWYDANYGATGDYFETIVESMSIGLWEYTLRPGVVIEREERTDPVYIAAEMNSDVQISLGERGYYLRSDRGDAWMVWYFTRNHGGVLAADLSMGADCSANVYISEAPLAMYDNRSHGQIPVEGGGTLYWYCVELYDGSDSQLADLMGTVTASGAADYRWGGSVIDDKIYSRQSMGWSGWETVETDGGRTTMMFNMERPALLNLGDPIAQQKINGINWTLYITEEYSSERWPFIWAVPDVDPDLAIGSDYENAVYKYYEDNGMVDDFDGDIWTAESMNGAAEMIFEVLTNYYPQ